MIHEQLGIDQTGLDQMTLPQLVVMSGGIEGIDITVVDMLDTVQRIGAGQHPDSEFADLFTGKIGAAVGKNGKGHIDPSCLSLFPMIAKIFPAVKKNQYRRYRRSLSSARCSVRDTVLLLQPRSSAIWGIV